GSGEWLGRLVEDALRVGVVEKLDDGAVTHSNRTELHVLSLDPALSSLRPRRVSAFVRRTAPKKMVRIKSRRGESVIVTPYHPVFTVADNTVRALRADELAEGVPVLLASSDLTIDQIEQVDLVSPTDQWVYDLCVDETHNFVEDGFVVHNSNVAYAVRWALGENNARVLRAKRNEELIFGGSETRKALSHAEALLQLDNSSRRLPIDFAEIEVGRRLFRNGEAEYLVNRSRVRLRDLQDLLAGANLADNPF